ncbi:MAG: glucuronate isomerase [Clostridia bacterium]
MSFINDKFMLHSDTAVELFDMVKDLPIVDYHCHLSPQEIAEDKKFKNAFDLFLSGDHYKWRQMRTNGIDEKYITGDGEDYEKFQAFAATMPYLIGNPLHHWMQLELKRYFDIDELLTPDTCEMIWNKCNEILASDDFSARNLIRKSNVKLICTTDNPMDDLRYHKQLKEEFPEVTILPTFRADLANIPENVVERMDYFNENGCMLSDCSVDFINDEVIENLIFLGEEYAKRGWVMQIHMNAIRNNNTRMFNQLGADCGFDSINDLSVSHLLTTVLNTLEMKDALPKTVIYTLNPKDNYLIGSMIGNFQKGPTAGKIQFGSGWWFNDQRDGMVEQMKALANLGMISKFIGMLTDSRSFVSYPRHEYFRRIMCNLIAEWVDNGEYPRDMKMLEEIVTGIASNNAIKYFGLDK